MKKEEKIALIRSLIMFFIALGWSALAFYYWTIPTKQLPAKVLIAVASIGWIIIFVIRLLQWRNLKASK